MSIKPVFDEITKMSYVSLCGHTTFVLLTLARTMTIIDKITITSTSVELVAINILRYICHKEVT